VRRVYIGLVGVVLAFIWLAILAGIVAFWFYGFVNTNRTDCPDGKCPLPKPIDPLPVPPPPKPKP
jgi:hypothetical protein